MNEILLSKAEAAAYLGLELKYFMFQVHWGKGPAFVRPSPRKTMFHKADLDAWKQTWANVASGRPVPPPETPNKIPVAPVEREDDLFERDFTRVGATVCHR